MIDNAHVATSYVVPRLREAFSNLRKQGYLARQRFSCCSSCAGSELACYVRDMQPRRSERVQGGVFYHRQDADALRGTYMSDLAIRYGRIHVHETSKAYGKEDVIPRAGIAKLHSQGLSLMPEGREQNLTTQDLADLLEFIATASP